MGRDPSATIVSLLPSTVSKGFYKCLFYEFCTITPNDDKDKF